MSTTCSFNSCSTGIHCVCVRSSYFCFLCTLQVDKFCPESCCVVGNYYSLKGKHENAVTYFQRAIKLNSKYVRKKYSPCF